MDAPTKQFCPLCRSELCVADAVRTHLIADHKRSTAEADELIARFEIARPISEPEPEPHMYCTTNESAGDRHSSRNVSAGPAEAAVN